MRNCRAISAVLVSVIVLAHLGACSRVAEPEPVLTFNPKIAFTRQISTDLSIVYPGQAISPDGKYLLAKQDDLESSALTVVPLDSPTDRQISVAPKEDFRVESIALAGWVSSTRFLFVGTGLQTKGPNEGKRGVSIFSADVRKRTPQELAFIELAQGRPGRVSSIPKKGMLYFRVSGALWEFNVAGNALRQVKSGLPEDDGFYNFTLSPIGEYGVYGRPVAGSSPTESTYPPMSRDLYILDTASGKEWPLPVAQNTIGYDPLWSPDGRYLAFYTAGRKADVPEASPDDVRLSAFEVAYDDGIFSVGSEVSVVDTNDMSIRSISIKDKVIGNVFWGPDSKTLAFIAGRRGGPEVNREVIVDKALGVKITPPDPYEMVYDDSLMTVDVSADKLAPSLLADLQSLPGVGSAEVSAFPLAIHPSGSGVFFSASFDRHSETWYVSSGKPPAKTASGGAYLSGRQNPIYGDCIVGIHRGTEFGKSITLFRPQGSESLVEVDVRRSFMDIVGFNDRLLVVLQRDSQTKTRSLIVYRMFN